MIDVFMLLRCKLDVKNYVRMGIIKMTITLEKTIEIILPRHKEVLNSGECRVIASNNSHIEGYFLKGEILKVVGITGSMLRVKNEKGFISYLICSKALLVYDFIERVYCNSCKSLDENMHKHGCDTLEVISYV